MSRLARALCLSALLAAPLHAWAAGAVGSRGFFGLLPVRDMTSFGFVRLDMRQSPGDLRDQRASEHRVRFRLSEHLGLERRR